ncbi:MAG: hypothetical protein M3Q60_18925 [Actinomycetota bacterium]|nr:hypothetical protein [Actinomycetota bacterium]
MLAETLDVAIPKLVESEIPKVQAPPEATPLDRARELIARQAEQDRQAANRALESTFVQPYFPHLKSEARRLLEKELDRSALAAAVADLMEKDEDSERIRQENAMLRERLRILEEAGVLPIAHFDEESSALSGFPPEQVEAWREEEERENKRIRRKLESMSKQELIELRLSIPASLKRAFHQAEENRQQRDRKTSNSESA